MTHERRLRILRGLLTFAIVSTALHFTHNFVEVDAYPSNVFSDEAILVAIVVSWPLALALALYAYRLYARGRLGAAHVALAVYAILPLTSLGHFTVGTPDVPPFWFATIFTDGIAGAAVLAFVVWSSRRAPAAAA